MATQIEVIIKAGALTYQADPKWLAADETEVPGSKLHGVAWFSSDERIIAVGDSDIGNIGIADPTLFIPGDQVLVTVTGDPAPGEDDPLIILEAIFTFLEENKPATHGELTVVPVV